VQTAAFRVRKRCRQPAPQDANHNVALLETVPPKRIDKEPAMLAGAILYRVDLALTTLGIFDILSGPGAASHRAFIRRRNLRLSSSRECVSETAMPEHPLRPLRWLHLVWLFGLPALLNAVACQLAIPYLDAGWSIPVEASYFLSVGLLVLAPMFFMALYLSGKDIGSFTLTDILARMRVKGLSGADWLWTIGAFVTLSFTSFLIAKVVLPEFNIDATPFFFRNMPLDSSHMWILYVWPLFFFFNIVGEEFLWRGYIQPRQELLTKQWTWLVHGLLWAAWHIPMGFDLIMAATPIFFVLPAVVQVRRNTTIAIVVHGVFGAFGFLALALGAVH
jgi:membrane protease YdiL (CAAX protease family)